MESMSILYVYDDINQEDPPNTYRTVKGIKEAKILVERTKYKVKLE